MMKKTLLILAYFIFLGFSSYGQSYNSDSIINLLEGKWGYKFTFGGFCGCKTESDHPYDEYDVWFEKHPTSNDSVNINYYQDNNIISAYAKVSYKKPIYDPIYSNLISNSPAGWFFENWPGGPFFGDEERYFSVSDSTFSLEAPSNVADLPTTHYERKLTQEIITTNCDGNYYYQFATPQPSDSVIWVLESGQIDFEQGSNYLNVKTSSNGAVISKKIYFNGNVATSSYVLNHPDNCSKKKYILQGQVFRIKNELWPHGMIYLYDTLQTSPVDSVQFVDGSYLFANVSLGTYTLYAVPYADSTLSTFATDYVGTYYVNKKTLNDANTFDIIDNTYSVDLSLIAGTTMSLEEISIDALIAYPNPFNDELTIKASQNGVSFRVFNVKGSLVYRGTGNQTLSLNTSDWKEGVYFVQVQTQNNINTITVIK